MIKIGIAGATGYVGAELIRLLSRHPQAHVAHICSQSYEGQNIQDLYPSLRGYEFSALEGADYPALAKACDVVFTALPHGASVDAVQALREHGAKVIDLSADFRYDDPQVYAQWYAPHKNPELMQQAVYGLPELYRQRIAASDLIANPGCYTTSAILALAPLLTEGVVSSDNLIIDSKSGVSGAGAKPSATVHFCEVDESLKAYSVTNHRHTSEIEQELSHAAGHPVVLSFTPHLLPVKRGILSTIYANLMPGKTSADAAAAYQDAYANEPFVDVYPEKSLPEIKHVIGSNRCAIGFIKDARLPRLVIVSCLDNLMKGAAGQAVQNMNIRFGLDEKTGLDFPAWYL